MAWSLSKGSFLVLIWSLASSFSAFCFLASGTPILNDMWDLWAQFRIMDKGESFGKNFFSFRSQYFYDKNATMPKDKYFPDWRIDESKIPAFKGRMNKYSMRVEKKDCLDLPPIVRQRIEVPLEGKQKRHYEEMKRDFGLSDNEKNFIYDLIEEDFDE